MIPWNCEKETWSEESEAQMNALVARFRAADKDGHGVIDAPFHPHIFSRTCSNGVIDFYELRDMLEMVGDGTQPVGTHWLTEEDVQAVIREYDSNGDGVLQWEEFLCMAQDKIFLQGQLTEYRKAFNSVDAGGNGTISATELYKLFERLEHPISYEKLVRVMEQYDVNQSGLIDFGEFLRMFRNELLDLQACGDRPQSSAPLSNHPSSAWRTDRQPGARGAMLRVHARACCRSGGHAAPALTSVPPTSVPQEVLSYIKTGDKRRARTIGSRITQARSWECRAGAGLGWEKLGAPATPSGQITNFYYEEELDLILEASNGRLVVVEASLTWCRPCKNFQPSLDKAAEAYSSVTFLKFFGNSNDTTKHLFKERLKCRSTPSFFFFRDGQVVGSCTGANGPRFEHNLRKLLKPEELPTEPLFAAYTPPVE
eukprot:scaffold10.g2293.t1